VRIIKDRNVVRCSSSKLDQEKPRGKKRLMKVYMRHFFNCLRLLASSSPVENRISRKSPWLCWSVYFQILTGMTRRERQVERCREGWRPSDRCVRCSVSDVFLVAEVAGLAVQGAVMLTGLADDGGGGDPQPYVVHHNTPARSLNPRNRRRTWSLRGVQSPCLPRPRRPHAHKTC